MCIILLELYIYTTRLGYGVFQVQQYDGARITLRPPGAHEESELVSVRIIIISTAKIESSVLRVISLSNIKKQRLRLAVR